MSSLVRTFQFSSEPPAPEKKTTEPPRQSHHKTPSAKSISSNWKWQIPYLGISLLWGVSIWFLLTHVEPALIANVIWPQSYLPLTFMVFLALFSGGSVLLQSVRRGLWLASCGTLFVYWRLHVGWAEIAFFTLTVVALATEGLLTWRHRR